MKLLRWLMRRQINKLLKRADFCDWIVIQLEQDIEKYKEEAAACRHQAKNIRIP